MGHVLPARHRNLFDNQDLPPVNLSLLPFVCLLAHLPSPYTVHDLDPNI